MDELPNVHVVRKAHTILVLNFFSLPFKLKSLTNEMTQFKVASRRYLKARTFLCL